MAASPFVAILIVPQKMAAPQTQSEDLESSSAITQSSEDVTANQTDSDNIFLVLHRSTRAIGKIYNELFDKSRADFTLYHTVV